MARKYKARLPRLEATPEEAFWNRRKFVTTVGAGVASVSSLFFGGAAQNEEAMILEPLSRPDVFPPRRNPTYKLPSGLRAEPTPRETAARHNNFYEFLPGRGGPVWKYADKFEVDPWKIEVRGLCNRPMTLDLDALFKFEHEERLYHFRCVERWAMNVPWSGFPLKKLIERADPKGSARFIRFVSARRPEQMPGLKQPYPWPYHEALRLDEAVNDLVMVVTGAYGRPLLKQHGSPARIIVPWKYGYKNPKSIVEIEFLAERPKTFWQIQPHEYGFLSNVNPNIPHPRWSQARSYWLDSQEPFETPIFNGYEDEVRDLYPDEPRTLQEPLRPDQIAR